MCIFMYVYAGHSKVRLIISNGGMQTIQEAIWHEKVILGVPIQNHHERNIKHAIDMGFAESINADNFTSSDITIKVRMLIENPIYHMSVRRASVLMKSTPMTPKETTIYWIEQVLTHHGLQHLKIESRKLSFYGLYMVDILSLIAIIILIYILIMQYHFIKAWIAWRERRKAREHAQDFAMNDIDKLKNE